MRSHLRAAATRLFVGLLGTSLSTACGRPSDASPRNSDHLDDTVRVAADQVGTITLKAIDSLRVHDRGLASLAALPEVVDVTTRGRTWYLLDFVSKQVLVIDSSGTVVDSVGSRDPSGGIESPVRLALAGDTLLVVDYGGNKDIRAFSSSGRELPFERRPHVADASDIAVTPSGLVVAFSGTSKVPSRGRALVRPARGDAIWTCPADRRFQEFPDGMLSWYDYTALGAGAAGKVACVQLVSPVVAVFDPSDGTTSFVTRVPPDYVAPKDQEKTQNAKKIAAYAASWTPHQIAYPTASGILSVYELTQYGRGRSFLLFACDSAGGGMRCGRRRIDASKIRFIPPDTLLVARTQQGVTLARYQVAGWY